MKCKHEIESSDGYPKCALCDQGTNCIACDPDKEYETCDCFEPVISFVRRTITIREDQDIFLKSHPETNFSAWVQRKIDEDLISS
jgi:hypothetical protein